VPRGYEESEVWSSIWRGFLLLQSIETLDANYKRLLGPGGEVLTGARKEFAEVYGWYVTIEALRRDLGCSQLDVVLMSPIEALNHLQFMKDLVMVAEEEAEIKRSLGT
jgi:hypothetical protein